MKKEKLAFVESLVTLLQNRPASKKNKNIHSDIHLLADEISTYFGEKRLFAMYLGIIKRVGVSQARAIFKEIQESKGRTAGRLFVFLSKRK